MRCNAPGFGPSFYYGDCVDRNSECAIGRHVDQTGGSAGSDSHRRSDRFHYFGIALEESAKQKQQIPGGLTIKNAGEMKLGRASNFEDLLECAPGVFFESENGAEISKISIRGSGITSEDEPGGVMFLLDGLNYNQGDGETILEDFDVGALSHAEIFRGAAPFKYGALTLGGAINLFDFSRL